MKRVRKAIIAVSAGVILLIAGFVVFGFYLVKQGAYIIGYGLSAQPISRLLASGTLAPGERAFLRLVTGIKGFAVSRLGLSENENYSTYAKVGRDYLVDVVSACRKDSFDQYVWQYPFFGGFPYKGFFERKDAEEEAVVLRNMNLDVIIRKVDAFSTLGFFKDPVYDFMADYSEYELASLIIHEETHATVWVGNEVRFNEELATFVGREGALLYLAEKYGKDSRELEAALASESDSAKFTGFVKELHAALGSLYESDAPASVKATVRGEIMHAYKERYRLDVVDKALSSAANREATGEDVSTYANSRTSFPVNNAFVMLFMGYEEDLSPFYGLYESFGRDLGRTIDYLKGLKKSGVKPMEYMKRASGG